MCIQVGKNEQTVSQNSSLLLFLKLLKKKQFHNKGFQYLWVYVFLITFQFSTTILFVMGGGQEGKPIEILQRKTKSLKMLELEY